MNRRGFFAGLVGAAAGLFGAKAGAAAPAGHRVLAATFRPQSWGYPMPGWKHTPFFFGARMTWDEPTDKDLERIEAEFYARYGGDIPSDVDLAHARPIILPPGKKVPS